MDEQKFGFIIVGTGNIANTYVTAINNIPLAEVVGLVSRSGRKPSALSASSNVETGDQIKTIRAGFDAVIICTPNGIHHSGVIEAAKLGKHVLVEKPLEISITAMEEMISACRSASVKLGVSYQRRVSGDNLMMKKLLMSRALGKVYAVDLAVKNFRDDAYYQNSAYRGTRDIDGGGPFMQQASHYIDLYAWFFGRPQKIESYLRTFTHQIEVEDHGIAVCRHADGMLGTIIASTAVRPGFPAKLEIHSEKGTVIMENDLITTWSVEGMENPARIRTPQGHTGAATAAVSDTTNHELIIKDFISAVKGDREPLINGEEGRIATEIILEIYRNNRG